MDQAPRLPTTWLGLPGRARRTWRVAGAIFFPVALCTLLATQIFADPSDDLKKEVDLLREQNRLLQEQVKTQQQTIDKVNQRMSDLEQKLQDKGDSGDAEESKKRFSFKNVVISGEGGVALFNAQNQGEFAKTPFRIDEARLFVESPIIENVYFYSELNLITRESYDENLKLGELYLDFENLSRFWNGNQPLTLRLGRFYAPFGEEYQHRYAINNPLISHSLSDLWDVDEGIELFGSAKKFSYAVAVQNGGLQVLNDATSDKSVAGRIGFDPTSKLHFSASAMRTGNIATEEFLSAMWFGNFFFSPLPGTHPQNFHANLFEGDAEYKWSSGYVHGAGGYAGFADDDPVQHHHRDIYYYYGEGLQHLTKRFYAAARFSQILAIHGYPLVGNGYDQFEDVLTQNLWRLSLGLGWRYNQNFLIKAEYSFERGREQDGTARHHEDMFGAEAAFQF